MRKTLLALALLALPFAATAQTKLAATPAMGWNSWNHFATHVTDKDVRDAADAIVSSGMKDAGYIYVNIDDAWQGKRDTSGNIVPNGKFPDMKALADYVHSKGLKIGIYSGPGPKTCGGYLGSYQHEEQDAKMYAQWGFDYLKYDLCSYHEIMQKEAPGEAVRHDARRLRKNAQGAPGYGTAHLLLPLPIRLGLGLEVGPHGRRQ